MSEVKAKIKDIDDLINAIKSSNEKMDTSVSSIKHPSKSEGVMAFTYVDKIQEISKLVESYKQLLDKDAEDILHAKEKIEEMDKEMGKLYST